MPDRLEKLYQTLVSSGKTDAKRLGSYEQFIQKGDKNLNGLYNELRGYGFSEKYLGDWDNFNKAFVGERMGGGVTSKQPKPKPTANEEKLAPNMAKPANNGVVQPNEPISQGRGQTGTEAKSGVPQVDANKSGITEIKLPASDVKAQGITPKPVNTPTESDLSNERQSVRPDSYFPAPDRMTSSELNKIDKNLANTLYQHNLPNAKETTGQTEGEQNATQRREQASLQGAILSLEQQKQGMEFTGDDLTTYNPDRVKLDKEIQAKREQLKLYKEPVDFFDRIPNSDKYAANKPEIQTYLKNMEVADPEGFKLLNQKAEKGLLSEQDYFSFVVNPALLTQMEISNQDYEILKNRGVVEKAQMAATIMRDMEELQVAIETNPQDQQLKATFMQKDEQLKSLQDPQINELMNVMAKGDAVKQSYGEAILAMGKEIGLVQPQVTDITDDMPKNVLKQLDLNREYRKDLGGGSLKAFGESVAGVMDDIDKLGKFAAAQTGLGDILLNPGWGERKGAAGQLATGLREELIPLNDMPDTWTGAMLSTAIGMTGMLVEMAAFPELRIARLAKATGGVVRGIPAFGVMEGTLGGVREWDKLVSSGNPQDFNIQLESLWATEIGTANGIGLHYVGAFGGETSKFVAKYVKGNFVPSASAFATTGTMFGTLDAFEQYLQTGKVDIGQSTAVGVGASVLSAPHVMMNLATDAYKKANMHLYTASKEVIQKAQLMPAQPEELLTKAVELNKEGKTNEANILNTMANVKMAAEDIVANPDKAKKDIEQSNLTDKEKEFFIDKVDQVLENAKVIEETKGNPLQDVESTSKAFYDLRKVNDIGMNDSKNHPKESELLNKLYALFDFVREEEIGKKKDSTSFGDLAEYYHKAKSDGTNPELVKAVEDLLKPATEHANPIEAEPVVTAEPPLAEKAKTASEKASEVASEVKPEPKREEVSQVAPLKIRGKEWTFTGEIKENGDHEFKSPEGETMWVAKNMVKPIATDQLPDAGKEIKPPIGEQPMADSKVVETPPAENTTVDAKVRELGVVTLYESELSIEDAKKLVKDIRDGNVTEYDLGTGRLGNVATNTLAFAKEALRNGTLADGLEQAIKIKENTKEAVKTKEQEREQDIRLKAEFIDSLKKRRDSNDFKYKEVSEYDVLGNRKKVKRLKTDDELKSDTDKINLAISKAESELAELEANTPSGTNQPQNPAVQQDQAQAPKTPTAQSEGEEGGGEVETTAQEKLTVKQDDQVNSREIETKGNQTRNFNGFSDEKIAWIDNALNDIISKFPLLNDVKINIGNSDWILDLVSNIRFSDKWNQQENDTFETIREGLRVKYSVDDAVARAERSSAEHGNWSSEKIMYNIPIHPDRFTTEAGIKGVLAHEFGHIWEGVSRNDMDVYKLLNSTPKDVIEKELGHYATTGRNEAIAEAFKLFVLDKGDSPFLKELHKAMGLLPMEKLRSKSIPDLQEALQQRKITKAEYDKKVEEIRKSDVKKIADKIREGKIDKDIMMSGIPFAKEVWNGAVETIAKAVEAGGEIARAFRMGLNYVKNSDWYKGLKSKDKEAAENKFNAYFKSVKEQTSMGVGARDISRTKSTKVLVDEMKSLKTQIRLEAKSARQAATYIAKFLDTNKAEIKEAGLTARDVIRIQKVAVKSENKAIELMQKLIEDGEYRSALRTAESSQEALIIAIKRGEFNRLTEGDKAIINNIAKIDIDGTSFSKEFLDSFNEMKVDVLKNKKVPSPNATQEFYAKYEQEIIDNRASKELTEDVLDSDVDSILDRVQKLYDTMQVWNADPDLIPKEEIVTAKNRMSYLINKARSLVKNGSLQIESDKYVDVDGRLSKMEDFINNDAELINQAIKDVESSFKNKELKEIDLSGISNKSFMGKYTQKTVDAFRRAIKDAKQIEISDKLSLNDIDNIKAAVDVLEQGYAPKILNDIIFKVEKAKLVNKVGKEIVEGMRLNVNNIKSITRLLENNTVQGLTKTFSKWDKSDLDKLSNLQKKGGGKPIEELLLGRLERSFMDAESSFNDIMKPLVDARNKAYSSKFMHFSNMLKTWRNRNTWDSMIGIAFRSLDHVSNLPNNLKKNKVDGEYEIVQHDGKIYQDGGANKRFTSLDEANLFITENVEKFFTPEELDFYHMVNFGKFSTKRDESKIFHNDYLNSRELITFDKAYKELQRQTGMDKVYFKTYEDAINALPKHLQGYAREYRNVLKSIENMASEVASREGINFISKESYFPYPNKQINVGDVGKTDVTDFNTAIPRVTNIKSGNIYERTKSIHYTDFNAARVINDYVRTLTMDYHGNAESKIVLKSLSEMSKTLAKEFRDGSDESRLLKIHNDALTQTIKDRFAGQFERHLLFGNAVVGYKGVKLNIGGAVREILGWGRSVALISAPRRSFFEPLSNIAKIPLSFIRKGDNYDLTRFLDSKEPLLEATKIVGSSVRSLSSKEYQYGNLDLIEVPSGGSKMGEWTKRNILMLGDLITGRPLWAAKFESRYKELTGDKFDAKRFSEDVDYQDAVFDNVKRSMSFADSVYEEAFPSQTKFGRAQQNAFFGIRNASDIGSLNLIMNTFGIRESSTWLLAMKDFTRGTNLGRVDAVSRVSGLLLANMAWMASGQLVYSGFKYFSGLINDDEAEKDRGLEVWRNLWSMEGLTTNILANCLMLQTGRFANAGRLLMGLAGAFTIDMFLKSEPDPVERKKQREGIKIALGQMKSVGTNVPESDEEKLSMFFPIVYQAMKELGTDAILAGKSIVEIGKKVTDGTATWDEMQYWALLKATHDVLLLRGHFHPLTKEFNAYLRSKAQKENNSVTSYEQQIKQLSRTTGSTTKEISDRRAQILKLYNNFSKNNSSDGSFEMRWKAQNTTQNIIENLDEQLMFKNPEYLKDARVQFKELTGKQLDITELRTIRRMPYAERYNYLQQEFGETSDKWSPFMTQGFMGYIYTRNQYLSTGVEDREDMFKIE